MAGEVITVSVGQRPPESWDACIVIGGPTLGSNSSAKPWQPEVLALLRERWIPDGRLVVFVPEREAVPAVPPLVT